MRVLQHGYDLRVQKQGGFPAGSWEWLMTLTVQPCGPHICSVFAQYILTAAGERALAWMTLLSCTLLTDIWSWRGDAVRSAIQGMYIILC
mmetsp:Transcript_88141/g.152671  ORF Transcript_88141/g.152671 Transcript_88141/m.152671 type:complete len:90 (+) Transcript_88141:216-485(+)